MSSNIPQKIGRTLAVVQTVFDDASDFCFRKLKAVGESKDSPKVTSDPDALSTKMMKAGKGLARFFGAVGESFYDEYEALKAANVKDKSSKK